MVAAFQGVLNCLASPQIVKPVAAGNRIVGKVHFSPTPVVNRAVTFVIVVANEP
jgi:hypothetical protein